MISLQVEYPGTFSRFQLILRLLLGPVYILIPHLFTLVFVVFFAYLVWVYVSFYILLFGIYPVFARNYLMGVLKWVSRLHLTVYNLSDAYPKIGIYTEVDYLKITETDMELRRITVLWRFLFAGLLILPHLVIWFFRNIWSVILSFFAFWMVLITGKYPKNWFDFNIGTLRWLIRVVGYQLYLSDNYPPFTGKK
ncbi:MAG: hypothetical protein ACI85Q_001071 [Salibacteraceae bacterium]|jgi:hypothetical protein